MNSRSDSSQTTSWLERKAQAEALCAVPLVSLETHAEELRAFAGDGKWEVRKVIADALARFPDVLFHELGPVLAADNNVFVSAAARRASGNRIPAANLNECQPGEIQQEVDRIANKWGSPAAAAALKLAHQITERHLNSAVHDIRNILTSVSLDVGKFSNLSDYQKRKLRRVARGADYLSYLMEVMAHYADPPPLDHKRIKLSDLIADAHASAIEQIELGGRSVEKIGFDVSVPEKLTVRLSRFHIDMVLTNLIKNGFEAHFISPEESRPGRVAVRVDVSADFVAVAVSDQGCGMSPSDLAQRREFIPGGSTKKKSGSKSGSGAGYGLPICKVYVEAHGGRLQMESLPGEGTTVTLYLPQRTDEEEQSQ